MGQLAVHLLRHGADLQQQEAVTGIFDHRRDLDIDLTLAEARARNLDAVFVDRHAALENLFDQREDGATEGDDLVEAMTFQKRGT